MHDGLRAEAIFHSLKQLRTYCKTFPDYNVAVNLNGMNGAVDVKIFRSNQVVECYLDPDGALYEMLSQALQYMEGNCGPLPVVRPATVPATRDARVNWMNFATCARCHAVMGQPCERLDQPGQQMAKPHVGRVCFRRDKQVNERA